MNTLLATACVACSLFVALLLGRRVHRSVPEQHLSGASKDAVQLAMGLVATMTALILGLLVSSAKSNYDTERGQMIEMAAKVVFLDRVLSLYGADAKPARDQLRGVVADAIQRIWPTETALGSELSPNQRAGDAFYVTLQRLAPGDDAQRELRTQALTLTGELGQLRTLLQAQSVPSVSLTLLIVVTCWLVVIFFGSSLLAPPNSVTGLAFVIAACSVAAAVFLILELDQPFTGMLRISSEPMVNVMNRIGH